MDLVSESALTQPPAVAPSPNLSPKASLPAGAKSGPGETTASLPVPLSSQATVGQEGVALLPPSFDQLLGLCQRVEDLRHYLDGRSAAARRTVSGSSVLRQRPLPLGVFVRRGEAISPQDASSQFRGDGLRAQRSLRAR